MTPLDVLDRAERVVRRQARRERRRHQWRAIRLYTLAGTLIGGGLAAGFGLVWLAADVTGRWGAIALIAAFTVAGVVKGWTNPEDLP